LLSILAAWTAWSGNIHGWTILFGGHPTKFVPGVTVRVYASDSAQPANGNYTRSKVLDSAVTDSSGGYFISNVAAGWIVVDAVKPGYTAKGFHIQMVPNNTFDLYFELTGQSSAIVTLPALPDRGTGFSRFRL